MTHQERMLATLRGEPTDSIPWAPRLDLWYDANRRAGTLPPPYQQASLTGLLDCYLDSRIDVADSICPTPMTRLTFKEVRDRFDGHITIMGGIPSVCLLRDSMSNRAFDAYLDAFFSQLGSGDHLILGISDTTPPAAEFERLKMIARHVRAWGPVRPSRQPS